MRRYFLAALVAAFFMPGIRAEQWIVQLETGHPSAFGKGKAAFTLAKNRVLQKLPPQARVRRELGIINALVVEADSADALNILGVRSISPTGEAGLHLTQSVPQIKADQAQSLGFTGAGVKVGVIDTGVDYLHPDIEANYAGGYDTFDQDTDPMDEYYHGTHVAGTILGVAPGVELYAIKTFPGGPSTDWSYIIEGVQWAIDPNGDGDTSDHLDVINMSLGSVGTPDDFRCQAIHAATQAGVIAVISTGNWSYTGTVDSPGLCADSISVGATMKVYADEDPSMTPWSSQGPTLWFDQGLNLNKPDVVAPGFAICAAKASIAPFSVSCAGIPYRVELNGTSMSAPHVTGVVALIKQAHPEYGTEEIRRILRASATEFPYEPFTSRHSPFPQDAYGSGQVDALGAVTMVDPGPDESALHPTAVYLGNAAGEYPVSFSYSGPPASVVTEGYPVAAPDTVSGDFDANLSVPQGLAAGLYQTRIHVGGHEAAIVFIVDREPPAVPILLDPDVSQPVESPFLIGWQISDDACIRNFIRNRPEPDGSMSVSIFELGRFPDLFSRCETGIQIRQGTLNVPDGEYDLYAEVTDAAGNVTASNVYTVTVGEPPPPPPPPPPDPEPEPDTSPPVLHIAEPLDGDTVPRHSSFTVKVEASDESGIDFVRIASGDTVCTDRSEPFDCRIFTSGKPNTAYRILVEAQDNAGNVASDQITVYSETNRK